MAARRAKRAQVYRDINKSYKDAIGGIILACGKVCHPSKQSAKSSVRKLVGKGSVADRHLLNAYHCDKCNAWHVGHNHTKGKP